jgi:hemoglobin-like flavoprotein
MTPEDIHLLRKSFDHVERQSHVAALVFYQRLFELDPALRPLFKTNIEDQARKLMEMLGLALSLAEQPGKLEAVLMASGARHSGYGVREEHYATVGRAMLDMLAEVLGKNFAGATRQAWVDFYTYIAETMKRGAATMRSAKAGVLPGNYSRVAK